MTRRLVISILILCATLCGTQAWAMVAPGTDDIGILVADGNTAGTYDLIKAQGYDLEPPDESGSHATNPFQHIQQQWDNTLGKYVFSFYIHAAIDDDRGLANVTDRQRNEIKTGPHSPASLIAQEGETLLMKWKFKLPSGLLTTSKFSHIHQLKGMDNAAGNADVSLPVITLTCYTISGSGRKVLRLLHNDRTDLTTTSSKKLKEVEQTDFLGEWVEVVERVKFGANGTYAITITRMRDNKSLLSYSNDNIDMWRTGSSGLRPKWGIYRSVGVDGEWRSVLRDEIFLFADFSIEKVEAAGIESLTLSPSRKGEGSIYDLSGRKVATPSLSSSDNSTHYSLPSGRDGVGVLSKGIYIQEGRKIVIK